MKPKVGDASQAVEVPSLQIRDELRIRLGHRDGRHRHSSNTAASESAVSTRWA